MRRLIVLGASVAAMLASAPASAYELQYACSSGGGSAPRRVKNSDGSQPSGITMYFDESSMPGGSVYHNALVSALARYTEVPGAATVWTNPTGYAYADLYDNYSDMFVASFAAPGTRGQTYLTTLANGVYTHQTDPLLFLTGSCHIVAADVQVAPATATFTYNLPSHSEAPGDFPGTAAYNTGYSVVQHEWGHALGLLHNYESPQSSIAYSNFSAMNGAGAKHFPLQASAFNLGFGWVQNYFTAAPTQDDADGTRELYPDGTTANDVAMSAQVFDNSEATNQYLIRTSRHGFGPTTSGVCRGGTPSLQYSAQNVGTTTYATGVPRAHISTSSAAYSKGSGTQIGIGATLYTYSTSQRSMSTRVPCGTPPGDYWVYIDVDSGNASPGSDVNDVVRLWEQLRVANCNAIGCP